MREKLTPTTEEIDALRQRITPGPVTIINLLKFKPGPNGRAAYRRYMEACAPCSSPNAEIVYAGETIADVGGGSDWDYLIIARYPAFEDFAAVVTHPIYQNEAASHRPAALERTTMIVCQQSDLSKL